MEVAFSWLAVSCGAVAIFWLRFHYQRLNLKSQAPHLGRLSDQLDRLGEDVDALYAEMRSSVELLNERVDFAERLLSQRTAELPTETPSESTPA